MQVSTAASTSLLASIWALISGLLSTVGGLVGQAVPLRFLGQLLHTWGAPSSIGLQVLLEKVQLVGSGVYVAPPQLERYRATAEGVAWATMRWTGAWRAGAALGPACPAVCLAPTPAAPALASQTTP